MGLEFIAVNPYYDITKDPIVTLEIQLLQDEMRVLGKRLIQGGTGGMGAPQLTPWKRKQMCKNSLFKYIKSNLVAKLILLDR